MPGPRTPCQDTFRSSLPWQATRRLPVICSLPSLLPYPLYLASLVQVCWTRFRDFRFLPNLSRIRQHMRPFTLNGKNDLQMLDAATEHRAVSSREQLFLRPAYHFITQNNLARSFVNPRDCSSSIEVGTLSQTGQNFLQRIDRAWDRHSAGTYFFPRIHRIRPVISSSKNAVNTSAEVSCVSRSSRI